MYHDNIQEYVSQAAAANFNQANSIKVLLLRHTLLLPVLETITNPKEDLKGITTRSGVTTQGPKAVNHDAEVTKDTMPPTNNGSTEDVQ
ncbi:hypothetical protein Tco_1363595 [Tanacetum coccineum]